MTLLRVGIAIASDKKYEIECLQVILVPSDASVTETPVKARKSHLMMEKAVRLGKKWQVPIHTQLPVA